MSFESAIKKLIYPQTVSFIIENAKVIYSGRIYNFGARDANTGRRLFLKHGVKIYFEFSIPIGYDLYAVDGYEYYDSSSVIYVSSKQYTFLCLNQ